MTPLPSPQRVTFSIARIEAWAPGVSTPAEWRAWSCGELLIGSEGDPALQQMPAMLRRHAARLGRLSCEVAYRALDDAVGIPIVFCSRYGEMDRSVKLLTALAEGAELSPTSFGLSVHNAIAGLFAIARHDTSNCIALAGGDESTEFGILEACGLLADGADRVLLVVADLPLPPIYEAFVDVDPVAFAWACLLVPAGETPFSVEWHAAVTPPPATQQPPAAIKALQFLLGDEPELRRSAGSRDWLWRRHA